MLVSGAREAAGECRILKASGPSIGISPAARYADEYCSLQSPARPHEVGGTGEMENV